MKHFICYWIQVKYWQAGSECSCTMESNLIWRSWNIYTKLIWNTSPFRTSIWVDIDILAKIFKSNINSFLPFCRFRCVFYPSSYYYQSDWENRNNCTTGFRIQHNSCGRTPNRTRSDHFKHACQLTSIENSIMSDLFKGKSGFTSLPFHNGLAFQVALSPLF